MSERTSGQVGVIGAVMMAGMISGVGNLQVTVGSPQKSADVRLSFATAPTIALFIADRVIRRVRSLYDDLFVAKSSVISCAITAIRQGRRS